MKPMTRKLLKRKIYYPWRFITELIEVFTMNIMIKRKTIMTT